MADFSNAQISPVPNAVTPSRPVADDSAVISAQGQAAAIQTAGAAVGNAFQSIGGLVRGFRERSAAEAEGIAVSGFVNDLGRIDAALQQGSISPTEAAARRRSTLVTSMANNPTMADKFQSTFTSISGKSGFGAETPETSARNAMIEGAYTQGFINDNMDDAQKAVGLQNFQAVSSELATIEREKKRLGYLKSQADTDKSVIDAQTAKYNQQLKRSLPALGESFYSQTTLSVNGVLEDLQKAGGGAEASKTAVMKLEKIRSDVANQMTLFGAGAESDVRSSIRSIGEPIAQIVSDAIKVADGTLDKTVYENTVKTNSNKALINLGSQDDRVWKVMALSEVGGDFANVVATQSGFRASLTADFMANPSSPNNTYGNTPEQSSYLGSINTTQKRVNNGQVRDTKTAQAEVNERQNGVLESLADNGSRYKSGSELTTTIDHLASNEFGEFASSEAMNPEQAERAAQVVQQNYSGEVLPLVKEVLDGDPSKFLGSTFTAGRAFRKAVDEGNPTAERVADITQNELGSVSSLVDTRWTKNGVVFSPKDPTSEIAKIASSRLNKQLSPLINKSVRATTHLGGDTNYEAVFNEVVGPEIGLLQEEEAAPTEATPQSRIDGAFGAIEDAKPTPNERIDQAFEEVGDPGVPTESFNPIDVPGEIIPGATAHPLGSEIVPTEAGAGAEAPTLPEAQGGSTDPLTTPSRGNTTKQVRESLEAEGVDISSKAGWARFSNEVMKANRAKNTDRSGNIKSNSGTTTTNQNLVASNQRPTSTGNQTADAILTMVRSAEAPGGYNQVNGSNQFMPLNDMTLDQVLEVQKAMPRSDAHESSAVGAYQIIRKTLVGLKKKLGLTGDEKFTPELQDQLALALLEGRGLSKFLDGKMSEDQFQNNIASEWAGVPQVNGVSAYTGVGSNAATTRVDAVKRALVK